MLSWLKKHKSWALIITGSAVWSTTMVKSGLVYNYGMGFWGPNGHDGIWHLAIINSLSQFRADMPIFAGELLKNYHLGFDLFLAIVHKLTSIPISTLYFQITPPLLALAIGWLSYKLVLAWKQSESAALWAVFFTYFGGSLGWVLGKGESAFWSQQAISTLINPPFALSLVLLLLGLLLLLRRRLFLAILVFAVLPQIKIYGGLLAFGGLLIASLKDRSLLKVLFISAALYFLSSYKLLTTGSSLLVWQPGWYLETMMSYSDRIGWTKFYSAMTNYRLGEQWAKAILAYGVAFVIFIVGNLGTRMVGVWRIGKNDWLEMFMWSVIGGGIIIPMLFLQKGTPWNTIQFFYYSLFFSGLLAGVAVSQINKLRFAVWGLVIILTLPTTFQTLKHYLPSRPPAKLSHEELEALNFLSRQPRGVVLTYPFDKSAADAAITNPPRPLALYESTAYVAAFSGQPVYLEDEVNLNITGYNWPSRRRQVLDFFASDDLASAKSFLDVSSIKYLYLWDVDVARPGFSDTQLGLRNIFENSQVAIWEKK